MKRILVWFRKYWLAIIICAALLGILGDRAERAVGLLLLVLFALDLYGRFCEMERQISELHHAKNGEAAAFARSPH